MKTGTDANSRQTEREWVSPKCGQQVRLQHHTYGPVTGVLDMRTDDGTVIWVQMNDGGGRRLIHRDDGYRIDRAGGRF